MPFVRPPLSELIDRAATELETRLPGTDARLRRNILAVLGRTHAGSAHELYGYLSWMALQLMPDTAEVEHLNRWSSIWGIARRAAVAATGSIDFTGNDGAVIPAGTLLRRSDEVEFATDADAIIEAGTANVAVTAVEASEDGNTVAGTTLTLINPITYVQSEATVSAGGLIAGADLEDDESLRARLLTRIQQPPHGGAQHDYSAWALAAHVDVTRAWVYPRELGDGTVTVRIMTDDATVDGIPEQTVIDEVQSYIDEARPVTADVTVVAPIATPLDLTISGLDPDTAEVQAAVEAELQDLLQREAVPGGTILISHIREAVSVAAGEYDHAIVIPAANVEHSTGEIATLGTITWQ